MQRLVEDAAATGTKDMTTGKLVPVDIELTRFHALISKARYTTGAI